MPPIGPVLPVYPIGPVAPVYPEDPVGPVGPVINSMRSIAISLMTWYILFCCCCGYVPNILNSSIILIKKILLFLKWFKSLYHAQNVHIIVRPNDVENPVHCADVLYQVDAPHVHIIVRLKDV